MEEPFSLFAVGGIERNFDLYGFGLPQQVERNRLARLEGREQVTELFGGFHNMSVELGDDIFRLNAGFFGARAQADSVDKNAVGIGADVQSQGCARGTDLQR